jgi:hypothetical protein
MHKQHKKLAIGALGLVIAAGSYAYAQTDPVDWESRAVEGSRGEFHTVDGVELQIRYNEGPYSGQARNNWRSTARMPMTTIFPSRP